VTSPSPATTLRDVAVGFEVQCSVIGALIMRELHTRYGRDNIGYAWLLVEPMLLAAAVASLHGNESPHAGSTLLPVPFALGGYCLFMVFRSVIGRAESTLEANKPLLFHRMVTIFDMLAARALLEAAATLLALVVLLGLAWALGFAGLPHSPLLMLAAFSYMVWFAFALSMPICAAAYLSKAVAKFIHPLTYIAMPISGTFFLLDWMPEQYRELLRWFPLNQIFELFHTGQFASVDSPYFDLLYLSFWCLGLTFLGLLSLRLVRTHVHLS
jgi:capsular polysaccharide transport system permease protein